MRHPTEVSFRAHELASPDHILVATDLADTAYLLPHAIAQAKANGADLTLVHALTGQAVEGRGGPYSEESEQDRDTRLAMTGLKQQIEACGVTCRTICRHGFANDVIREALEHTFATRLIVGTHGRTKLGQIVLGSVTNDLLSEARVPVFAVGPSVGSGGQQSKPLKILHPVSFTGDYVESVRLAVDLAHAYRAELVLLHVLDSAVRQSPNAARTLEWAENALRSLLSDEGDPLPTVHVEVAVGDPVKEILKTANQTEADWIVMGIDGASPRFHFRDSAAYRVTAAAHCPVLTLPHAPSRIEPVIAEADHFWRNRLACM